MLRVINITYPDINNGLGIRATLWVGGCSHHCEGCHNKHTWAYGIGTDIGTDDGFRMVYDKLHDIMSLPYMKGITLSGGDPLDQDPKAISELHTLILALKQDFPDMDIWVYTGYVYEDLIERPETMSLLSLCDVLVDGPFDVKHRDVSLAFRGSPNQRIIDLNKTMSTGSIVEMDIE